MSLQNGVIITGGIACGKSTVCNELKQRGYSVLDADIFANEALICHKKEIIELFDCADANGDIDKAVLGDIVFKNTTKMKLLEKIIHPEVFKSISKKALELEAKDKIYFIDIPLFFETKARYDAMAVVVVYALREVQIKRLMARNGLDEYSANLRVNAQIDIEHKKEMADYVLDNSLGLQELHCKIDELLEKLNGIAKIKC